MHVFGKTENCAAICADPRTGRIPLDSHPRTLKVSLFFYFFWNPNPQAPLRFCSLHHLPQLAELFPKIIELLHGMPISPRYDQNMLYIVLLKENNSKIAFSPLVLVRSWWFLLTPKKIFPILNRELIHTLEIHAKSMINDFFSSFYLKERLPQHRWDSMGNIFFGGRGKGQGIWAVFFLTLRRLGSHWVAFPVSKWDTKSMIKAYISSFPS